MLTVAKLVDVNGEPLVKLDLDRTVIGQVIALRFRLRRTTGGRQEVLLVNHRFRVMAMALDASRMPHRQVLTLESWDDKAPTWTSVKRLPEPSARLSPAISPRTKV